MIEPQMCFVFKSTLQSLQAIIVLNHARHPAAVTAVRVILHGDHQRHVWMHIYATQADSPFDLQGWVCSSALLLWTPAKARCDTAKPEVRSILCPTACTKTGIQSSINVCIVGEKISTSDLGSRAITCDDARGCEATYQRFRQSQVLRCTAGKRKSGLLTSDARDRLISASISSTL
jgi:hypothetical protein